MSLLAALIGGDIEVTASGWGRTPNTDDFVINLRWAPLRTLTNVDCRSRVSEVNALRVFDTNICTFTREGQG